MMRTEVYKKILGKLRATKGCSLYDLEEALPKKYTAMDAPRGYMALIKVIDLYKWGLVEVYHRRQLITYEQLREQRGSYSFDDLLVFVSEQLFEIEEALGVKLDTTLSSVFGSPHDNYPWPEVFVVMPFAVNLKPIFDDHIKSLVEQIGLTVGRADDFFLHGSIIGDVWSAINAAQIIIADCTGRNPNVFYEIGIAHTIGKDTILITQSIDDVPFDLRHLRVIVYEYTPPGIKKFENALLRTVNALLKKPPNNSFNPTP